MSQFVIDTHATVREFEAAGIETRQAEAIVSAMANTRDALATKADLELLAIKEDLERFVTKEEAKQFATKADLETLRKDIEKQISGATNKMLIYMFSFGTLIIGVLKYL